MNRDIAEREAARSILQSILAVDPRTQAHAST
jgi:hypothetical protein